MAHGIREGLLLGMGNPLLDISATVDDEFLKKYDLKANNAILAEDKHKLLYDELIELYNADFIAGGSVQNTMRVAQWFLKKPQIATYMGCVGKDKYSKILEDIARANGLNVRYQYTDKEPTGTCAVLITGKERSLCANLAAANCFSSSHIEEPENKKLIEIAQYIYISGFFLTVSSETIQTVAKHALENNKMFMMNLSAPFLCEFYKKEMMAALPYVDILFAAKLPEEKVVDTNGAGDAFVGGFLAQLIQGKSIDTCIKCGIWAATEIVQKSGSSDPCSSQRGLIDGTAVTRVSIIARNERTREVNEPLRRSRRSRRM
ncbi:hypothetical protein KM043_011582 [Ampulex compressa]|nr:hypothetical protein KM043_011582 [Ampulex compressa]